MSIAEPFTQLAYQFGPFFFAVLFTLFVTRTARSWYVAASAGPDQQEKATFRLWFLLCACFSIVLVVISTAWYGYYNWRTYHALEGMFTGLRPYQFVAPDTEPFFIKEVMTKSPGGDIRDYYFVLVRNRPWVRGEKILFKYWELPKESGEGAVPEPATVEARLVETDTFPARFVLKVVEGKPVIEQRP